MRARFYERARTVDWHPSSRCRDFAGEAFGAPVEVHLAFQLTSDHSVHHVRAEAAARGRFDGRSAVLRPVQDQAPAGSLGPRDLNRPVRHREGAILGGVCSQLMYGDRDGLSDVRFQQQVRTVKPNARVVLLALGRQFLRDETEQVGSGPPRLDEKPMGGCECLEASLDCAL